MFYELSIGENVKKLTYLLNADINLTSEDSNEELNNSIRVHHVPLIIQGERLNRNDLRKKIIELRSKNTPKQKVRERNEHEFFLLICIAQLSTIVRFSDYFKME